MIASDGGEVWFVKTENGIAYVTCCASCGDMVAFAELRKCSNCGRDGLCAECIKTCDNEPEAIKSWQSTEAALDDGPDITHAEERNG